MELPKNTRINEYTIDLIDGKQPLYKLVYTFSPVKLEILNTYIEIYLKTGFIRSSKSSTSTLIQFDKKPNNSLHLCINY